MESIWGSDSSSDFLLYTPSPNSISLTTHPIAVTCQTRFPEIPKTPFLACPRYPLDRPPSPSSRPHTSPFSPVPSAEHHHLSCHILPLPGMPESLFMTASLYKHAISPPPSSTCFPPGPAGPKGRTGGLNPKDECPPTLAQSKRSRIPTRTRLLPPTHPSTEPLCYGPHPPFKPFPPADRSA